MGAGLSTSPLLSAMLTFSFLNTKCYLVPTTPRKASGTVLPNERMGKLSPLGGNGGLSAAQRPEQGEGSETSNSPEAPVDWACALRSVSEGTGAAGDSGSSCFRNHGSVSRRGLLCFYRQRRQVL